MKNILILTALFTISSARTQPPNYEFSTVEEAIHCAVENNHSRSKTLSVPITLLSCLITNHNNTIKEKTVPSLLFSPLLIIYCGTQEPILKF